jgi:transcriptional regulator
MYVPRQFREERREVLAAAMRRIQFAALVTAEGGRYFATHVPTVLKETADGGLILEAHVARANDHWTAARAPVPSLALFQGPQTYVSPAWYPSKREHGKVVPTWNYIAIQAEGPLEAVEDTDWLLAHINDLTRANEEKRSEPWEVNDAPEDFIQNLTRAIVGLRLRVNRVEGSWKMAQHRSEGDRHGVIAGLSADGEAAGLAVAAVMTEIEASRRGG